MPTTPKTLRLGTPAVAGPLLGIAAGAAIVILAGLLGSNPAPLAALPLGLALLVFLILDKAKLLVAILVLRSAGDIVLDTTRVSLGSYQIGAGGLINAFVIGIVALMAIEESRRLPRAAITAWVALLLAALAGMALAPVKTDALRTVLALFSYFAVFAAAFFLVRSPQDFRFCVRLILWSSAIPAAWALVDLASTGGMPGMGFRLRSTFSHPNIFAFYLTAIIALTLYTLKTTAASPGSTAKRAALGLYMLYLVGLLVLTQTRSAWIACCAVFAIYAIACERRYLLYLLAVPPLALLVPGVQDRLLDLGSGNEYVQYARLNSFAWRRLLWETGLRWMQPDHYLAGYGLESFRHYSLTFFPLADPDGRGLGAHNVYVQLVFELGAIGLAAFLWLFYRLACWAKALFGNDRRAGAVMLGLTLAYLITAASDNMFAYLSFNWYFWFLAGAAAAAVTTASAAGSAATPAPPRSSPSTRPVTELEAARHADHRFHPYP